MPKFKDTNNQVHFLDQADIDAGWLDKIQGANTWTPITDAEADAILNPPPTAAELQAEKDAMLTQARDIREQILNRLSGILVAYLAAGDTSHNAAIEAARQGLLNMPADPRVVAATDGASTKTAVMAVYGEIAKALATADPASVSAFNGMSL